MIARLLSAAASVLGGALLLATVPVALADAPSQGASVQDPERHAEGRQPDPEKMRAFIHARLEKLAARLDLKAPQQTAWNAFAGSVEALAARPASPPADGADATTIARYRADLAAGFARRLAAVADTTARLQAALDRDQQQTFNEAYRRFRHDRHGCGPQGDRGAYGRGEGADEGGEARTR